ncbi:carboxypeptidase-like regulatory domain-containing protein [Gimesia panareensis]|uniref:carboxypeptidase-like regulatory domain-containing protein n=1 Tax=Gimesia panareensis TaxID=2527978 RepID=UPI00118C07CC|nr:carboxypeptidase-like regulatory domain-containing protein [Gimesia panareensis]QDU48315.1 hypothetical protein Pan110_06280 [Gimesia panareensis]
MLTHSTRAGLNPAPTLSRLTLCLLLTALVTGCGAGVDEVPKGTVKGTVKLDGKPLSGARVNFTSGTAGAGAYADLQQDGTYAISDPIPAGDYKVYLSSPGLGDAPPDESGNQEMKDALKGVPEKYQSDQSTDLQTVIKEGENTFDIDLKP